MQVISQEKKSIYKKWWFWTIILAITIPLLIGGLVYLRISLLYQSLQQPYKQRSDYQPSFIPVSTQTIEECENYYNNNSKAGCYALKAKELQDPTLCSQAKGGISDHFLRTTCFGSIIGKQGNPDTCDQSTTHRSLRSLRSKLRGM